MKKKSKLIVRQVVGIFSTLQAASRQVDLILYGSPDIAANIQKTTRGYQVYTVAWK